MADYVYPANDLDRRQNLLNLLGTHWSSVYEGRSLVSDYVFARGQLELSNYYSLLELVATLSRHTAPVFNRRLWYFLRLRESQQNSAGARFGEGYTFESGIRYQVPPARSEYAFPLPDNSLTEIPVILNRIAGTSRTWLPGTDYRVDRETREIIFRENPFDDPYTGLVELYEDGNLVDREAGLWVYQGGFDEAVIHTHYGFIVGLQLPSSLAYRDLVNAFLDALAVGTSALTTNLAISAITGVPVVRENRETVELVSRDSRSLLICTNKHCYRYRPADIPLVAEGDDVTIGQFLTQAVRVDEFNRGQIPAGLRGLATGQEVLGDGFSGDLLWVNEELPVTVSYPEGRTRLEWPLAGFPTDHDLFWDEVHRRGLASGETLPQLLDTRRRTP